MKSSAVTHGFRYLPICL
ncbi:MAG: CRISPR-associated DxTHG motif protein [Bacteriovoracaceae bacterium]